jgi:tetratricopeptide (TPR) repeat protein
VEQALRLLPDVDALAPLRTFLISMSQSRPAIEPHATVGKRLLKPEDLRDALPQMLDTLMAHTRSIIIAAIEALEAEQNGDIPGVVRALLPAGKREEDVGRYSQAREWYNHALRVAEGLRDRRPEIEALLHVAHLEVARGALEQAARLYERAFRLAEAEDDHDGAAAACEGQGEVAKAQSRWQGAESWYQKGLKFAADTPLRGAYLHLGLGEVSRCRGLLEVSEERLGKARELFESAGHPRGKILTLNAWGQLEADMGRNAEAIASWLDALAELHRAGGGDPRLEMQIRLNMCRLYLEWGRLAEAEDEVRKAEALAITNNFGDALARLYLLMGKLRGRQNDEAGFVFFEQALEQCQGALPSPRLEAEVYREYAQFKFDLGEREEAIDYLGRAREILETSGHEALLIKVENELEQMKVQS